MSLYGEWKAGFLTDSEYTAACKREALEEEYREKMALKRYDEEQEGMDESDEW